MKLAERFEKRFDTCGTDQRVIVIRQNTPGVNVRSACSKCLQESLFTLRHSFRREADDRKMFVAGRRDEIGPGANHLPMRRRMPGNMIATAFLDNDPSLFCSHSPVVVHEGKSMEYRL